MNITMWKTTILSLALIFSVLLLFSEWFYGASNVSKTHNDIYFMSAPELQISHVGIALSNTIWTQKIPEKSIPIRLGNITNELGKQLWGTPLDSSGGFIESYMSKMDVSVSLLNEDLREILDSTNEREKMLNTYIQRLETDLDVKDQDGQALSETRTHLREKIRNYESDIRTLQAGIEISYNERNGKDVVAWVQRLSAMRSELREAQNQETFVSRFLYETNLVYKTLNERLEILSLNRDALIKNTTVYTPENTLDYIKSLNLIGENE